MVQRDSLFHTFSKQALSMTWDFAEVNVLADCTRSLSESMAWTAESIEGSPVALPSAPVTVAVADARQRRSQTTCFATDPPYYDNIGYADLSDYFYVWLRRVLKDISRDEFRTLLVPKAEELIAAPYRTGGSVDAARDFFERGLSEVFRTMRLDQDSASPLTIFYAFKQSESDTADGRPDSSSSTGWETFLTALDAAGLSVDGTWPITSERAGRQRDLGSNALASSIVLVCRKRPDDAATTTRGDFRRMLRRELRGRALRVNGRGLNSTGLSVLLLEARDEELQIRVALEAAEAACGLEDADKDPAEHRAAIPAQLLQIGPLTKRAAARRHLRRTRRGEP